MQEDQSLPGDPITRRLNILIALALRSTNQGDIKTKEDAIFLASFGLKQAEIAAILGISVNGISKALGRAKKS